MNRAVMLRIAACAVMGLGAALLIAALLLSTYTADRIAKIPLDIDTTLISEGNGTALNPASLQTERVVVNKDVPLAMQQQISVETPANADVVTLQVGSSVRRTDRQKDDGLLLAIVDTVTLNRTSAQAVTDDSHAVGAVQNPRPVGDENPPTASPVPHEGLSYRFPFHTEKQTYKYFDPIARQAYDATYQGEEDVNGLSTYRFVQNVGCDDKGRLKDPVRYISLYGHDEDGQITTSAAQWGIESENPEEQIAMTRYYATQRTFWVDPVSGTIVKTREHANQYYAREADKPELTLADYTVTSTEETVEAQVNAARNERDRLSLWSRVLPISFTATGLIALLGGAVLGWFGLRTEAALIDPGLDTAEHGFFEGFFGARGRRPDEPVHGAEAVTEKIPAQFPGLEHEVTVARPNPPDDDDAPQQDSTHHS